MGDELDVFDIAVNFDTALGMDIGVAVVRCGRCGRGESVLLPTTWFGSPSFDATCAHCLS